MNIHWLAFLSDEEYFLILQVNFGIPVGDFRISAGMAMVTSSATILYETRTARTTRYTMAIQSLLFHPLVLCKNSLIRKT